MTQRFDILILDASCLLNLCATGRSRDIALTLPYRLGVADYVLEREVLYVWLTGLAGTREERVSVDLSPLMDEDLMQVMSLESEEEERTFVGLAALVDDGEAMTGAIALHRGYAVATDDRKARRVLAKQAQSVPIVSTLDLLKQWVECASVSEDELRGALVAMRSGASYLPGARDPLDEWWRTVMYGDAP